VFPQGVVQYLVNVHSFTALISLALDLSGSAIVLVFLDHGLVLHVCASASGMDAINLNVKHVYKLLSNAIPQPGPEKDSASWTPLIAYLFSTSATDDVTVAALVDWSAGTRDADADGTLQDVLKILHRDNVGVFQGS
jgi:hypothetical protein